MLKKRFTGFYEHLYLYNSTVTKGEVNGVVE
jgi:hypothetical protein